MLTGEQIKKAIKASGLTLDEASTKLGISRQTLYIHLNKAIAEKKFVDSVKEKLPEVDLEKTERSPTNDNFSGVNEPDNVYGALKDQLISSQQQTIDALNRRIETLLKDIERLQKETIVHQQGSTGKRRSA